MPAPSNRRRSSAASLHNPCHCGAIRRRRRRQRREALRLARQPTLLLGWRAGRWQLALYGCQRSLRKSAISSKAYDRERRTATARLLKVYILSLLSRAGRAHLMMIVPPEMNALASDALGFRTSASNANTSRRFRVAYGIRRCSARRSLAMCALANQTPLAFSRHRADLR